MQRLSRHVEGVDISLNSTLALLRRRWLVLVSSMLVVLLLAAVFLTLMPRQYTATVLLQIHTAREQVINLDDVVTGMAGNDAAIQSEIDVMTSRRIAERVITDLKLIKRDPALTTTSIIESLWLAARTYLGWYDRNEIERLAAQKERQMTRAVHDFTSRLRVQVLPRSYTIKLQYTAATPEDAARIANATALAYLNSQLEDRFDATRRANDWVNERLTDLQRNVQAAETAVQIFRDANGLAQARGMTLTEQQLSELNSQLILARTQLAETEAKYERSRKMASSGGGIETTAEVINNPLIQRLREQETEVRRSLSDLSARYGERHPRMITVRNELSDIRRKIGEESRKIQGSLGNDVAVVQARVRTLEDQLDALEAASTLSGSAEIQLAELERQAAAGRSLYESFLTRSKEIAQLDFSQSDAKIISSASIPLSPSSPKPKLMLLMALVFGAALGAALVVLIEVLDSAFRTVAQVESVTGLPVLAMLGELPDDVDVARYASLKPSSAFAESVRALKTNVHYSHPDKTIKVWAVTSSMPEEGKSTLALALAQTLAMSGARVLLMDTDMRKPSIARQLGVKAKHTLGEVLVGQSTLKQALIRDKNASIDVLPSKPDTKFALELLSSAKMTDLMAELRGTYDAIVMDTPPVMAVADVVALSPHIDALIYAVRWGATPRPLAATAMKQLRATHVPLVGAVLARVDLDRQIGYGAGDYSYYYGRYKGYYNED